MGMADTIFRIILAHYRESLEIRVSSYEKNFTSNIMFTLLYQH